MPSDTPYDQALVLDMHLRDAGQLAYRCLHSYIYYSTINSGQCTESARASVNWQIKLDNEITLSSGKWIDLEIIILKSRR